MIPGPSSIPPLSTDSYSDILRRELDSRFLNSTPGGIGMGSILPPPPLTAGSSSNKLLDPSMYHRSVMHPPLGLPGLTPSAPYPPHSVGYGLNPTPSMLPSTAGTGVPGSSVPGSSGGGIMSSLGGLTLPTVPPNPSLPLKSVS